MRALVARLSVWLAASFAAAAAAHALLGPSAAYAQRAHVAIVPLALLVAALAAAALGYVARRTLEAGDVTIARRIGGEIRAIRRPLAIAAVTCGALATLVAVESLEQVAAHGRITGLADALGGNLALGGAIVCSVATAVVGCMRRWMEPVAHAAAVSTLRAAVWLVACRRKRTFARAAFRSRGPERRRIASGPRAFAAHGLRAPPSAG